MRMADDETCAQACGALAQLDGEISAFSSIEFVKAAMLKSAINFRHMSIGLHG